MIVIDGMMYPEETGRRYWELLESPAWLAFCKRQAENQVALIAAVGKAREIADQLKAEGVSNWNINTDLRFIEARRLAESWKREVGMCDEYRFKVLKPFMEAAVPFMFVPNPPGHAASVSEPPGERPIKPENGATPGAVKKEETGHSDSTEVRK